MSTPHPGQITFVDATAGTERTEAAAQVPETIAFVTVEGQKVPVVRVVARTARDRREIQSFGADGRLLKTTYQSRPPEA
jgi:hypothetical protein